MIGVRRIHRRVTDQTVCMIYTHVVIIVDLKECARVALKADLETICRGGLERIHDIRIGICLCT